MNSRRKWSTRRLALTGLGLFVARFFSAYPYGIVAAYVDYYRGHYEMKKFGALPPMWVDEYEQLVKARYGVQTHRVAGCVLDQDIVWYVSGYNSTMLDLLKDRHGRDIFEECANEVRPEKE